MPYSLEVTKEEKYQMSLKNYILKPSANKKKFYDIITFPLIC